MNERRCVSIDAGLTWLAIAALMLAVTVPLGAWAQESTSTIVGTVTDPSGAVVPGAQVTVTNAATQVSRAVTTGANGDFTVPYLPVGTYNISVKASGFQTATRSGIVTVVAQVARVDFQMKLGQATQSLTVTGAPPLLESETSDVGEVVTPDIVQLAPLNARNFTQLATLVPGVVRASSGSPISGGGGLVGGGGLPAVGTEGFRFQTSGGSALVISGLRSGNNDYVLDGVDNNEPVYNQVGIFAPPDSIQEFKIITATPPAQYGRAGGGVISVVTKSGTNQFHGSAYEFFRNSALDSRNFFNPATDASGNKFPKFGLHRNEWGGTVGGPIRRDKAFFFFDYNGFRNIYPASAQAVTVPTNKLRSTGSFDEYGVTVCDPTTSTPAVCNPNNPSSPGTFLAETGSNAIPQNMIDKPALALLDAFPPPNTTGIANGTRNNYLANRSRREAQFHFDTRIDDTVSSRDTLMGRLTWDNLHRTTPSLFPKVPAGFGTGREASLSRGVVVSETHIFTANLVNDFRFGFLRTGVQIHEPGVYGEFGLPVSYGESLGIPNSNPNPGAGGLPLIAVGDGLFSDGGFVGDGGTFQVPSDSYQWTDTLASHHGRQDIKVGLSIIRRGAKDAVGNFAKGVYVYAPWGGATTGDSLSDMLLGVNILPNQSWGSFGRGPLLAADQHWYEMGYFIQDDFKVSPRLTLNLGLRYDVFTNFTESNNRISDFDPTTGHMRLPGGSLIDTDLNNFGPHVGFAYRLGGNTVVRGGFATMYSVESPGFSGATPNLALNPPFAGFDVASGVADPNGWGVDFKLSQGLPTFTPSINPNAPTGTVVYEDPHKRTPYVNVWNISAERQFGSWLFSLAGVGTMAHKLGALRPLSTAGYTVSGITAWEGRGNSSYNSLQFRAEKYIGRGFSMLNGYTWSHCLTNSEGIVSSEGFGGGNFPEDTNKLFLEKGTCENDHRSILTQAYNWDLPFGPGKRWGSGWGTALNQAFGGWSVSGINLFESGDHLTPVLSGGSGQRPDLVPGQDPNNGPRTIAEWFNTKAFAKPAGPDGTAGRGIILGPGRFNMDFSVLKEFSLPGPETNRIQFRTTFYNVFNHPQFGDPSPSLSGGINAIQSSGFGVIDHAYAQRQVEFTFKILF